MRYSAALPAVAAVLASLAAPAAAGFDRLGCNGVGACVGPSGCNYDSIQVEPSDPEWDCGSAGTINGQKAAGATLNFWQGLTKGKLVAPADFPRCDLAQPSSQATLLRSDFEDGITVFGWIEYSCPTTEKFDSCYTSRKNPSVAYTCKVLKNGQVCKNILNKVSDQSECPK